MTPPRFLHDPKATYRALVALLGACAFQLVAFVALEPTIAAVFGAHAATIVTGYAQKAANALTLLIAVLGWVTATGRSIVSAIDNPSPPPPAAGEFDEGATAAIGQPPGLTR